MGNSEKLTRKQELAIAALLSERTHGEAARKVGIGTTTLNRWLTEENFKEAFATARRQTVEHAITRLQSMLARATERLSDAIESENQSISLKAIQLAFDNAIKGSELMDLNLRIEKLEKQLAEKDKPKTPVPESAEPEAGQDDSPEPEQADE